MEVILDKAGFPMAKVSPEDFWIHVWPVTKIQFESFLCAEPNSDMNAEWYDKVLKNNPRETPARVNSRNYWRLFVAGISPEEIQLFAEWNGKGFAIPTADEWLAAYRCFQGVDVIPNLSDILQAPEHKIDSLVEIIAQKIQEIGAGLSKDERLTLADQFLMRRGIMEWVRLIGESSEWGGLGEPAPQSNWSTTAVIRQGRPEIVRVPNVRHYGFRLIKRM